MTFGIFIVYKYAEIISNFGYFVNRAVPLPIDNLGDGEEWIFITETQRRKVPSSYAALNLSAFVPLC